MRTQSGKNGQTGHRSILTGIVNDEDRIRGTSLVEQVINTSGEQISAIVIHDDNYNFQVLPELFGSYDGAP